MRELTLHDHHDVQMFSSSCSLDADDGDIEAISSSASIPSPTASVPINGDSLLQRSTSNSQPVLLFNIARSVVASSPHGGGSPSLYPPFSDVPFAEESVAVRRNSSIPNTPQSVGSVAKNGVSGSVRDLKHVREHRIHLLSTSLSCGDLDADLELQPLGNQTFAKNANRSTKDA